MISISDFTKKLKNDDDTQLSLGNLDFLNANNDDIAELAAFIKTTTNRTFVSFYEMDWSHISFDKLQPLFNAMSENSNIKKISFFGANLDKANDALLSNIYSKISSNNFIRKIDLSHNDISGTPALMSFLVKVVKLNINEFSFNNTKLEECPYEHLQILMKTLAENSALNSVSLDFFNVNNNEQYLNLLSILFKGHIKEIYLSHSTFALQFSTNDFIKLFNIISSSLPLRVIELSSSNLEYIAIEDSDVENNPVESLKAFENFLRTTENVDRINISHNDFSEEILKKIIDAALSNPRQVNISVENNLMSAQEVNAYIATKKLELLEQEKKKSADNMPSKTLIHSNGTNGHSNLPRKDVGVNNSPAIPNNTSKPPTF